MARVRDIGIDEVPEDAKPVYQRFADEYGPFLNQVKIFAHRPIALRHLMGMLLEMADNPILCLLYTSPSPRDGLLSRMPSSA